MGGVYRGMLLRQGAQGVTGSGFQEDSPLPLHQFAEAIGKTNGLAQMRRPIIGVGRFLRRNPFAGDVRDAGNLRRVQLHFSDLRREQVERGLHHLRMKRVRGVQPPAGRAPLFEFLLQRFDGVMRSRSDAQRRRIDRRQRKFAAQQRFEFRFGQTDRQHGAGRLLLHQATARGDQGQRVFKRKNSGQTRGHVFAHAVADHRLGLSAPAHPELRQCILDDKQRRLREEGLAQLLGRLLKFVRLRIKNGTQVKFQMRLENFAAAVHLLPEHRLGLVKLAAHAHLLGALAGKHESDTGLLLARLSVENAFRVAPGQRLHRLRDAAAEGHPPMAEGLSAGLQSKGDVGQIDFGPAHDGPDGRQQITIVDPRQRVMAVYHVDRVSGALALKSVRNLTWDLLIEDFNSGTPAPRDIRALKEQQR